MITFQNSVNVEFNLIETICDPIMPVTANVFNFWPELLRFQDQMTTKIPRPSLQVDMLIGLKDLYRVLYKNMTTNPVVRINEKSGLKLEETYFGYLLKGGINNALIYEIGTTRMKKNYEVVNLCREIPMDHLLEKIFDQELMNLVVILRLWIDFAWLQKS